MCMENEGVLARGEQKPARTGLECKGKLQGCVQSWCCVCCRLGALADGSSAGPGHSRAGCNTDDSAGAIVV